MKLIGKKVKVIDNLPDKQQVGVRELIGKTYKVTIDDRDNDGTISIDSPEFGGQISLQPGEWKLVK